MAVAEGDGWEMAGDAPLDEVERVIDRSLPEGDYETLSGLVISAFEGLPAVGDVVEIPLADTDPLALAPSGPTRLVVTVREVAKRVPSTVFVALRDDEEVSS